MEHVARIERRRISVRGVVQGVGFRPFVYRMARERGLAGWVLNHSGGVDIEVEGFPEVLDRFVADLTLEAPPLAHIAGVDVATLAPSAPGGVAAFEIRHSEAREGDYQLISPDIATCPDCLRELLDPLDRRFRYPFVNCTNCGPRFTIIESVPYDRPRTTMRDFPMCPECRREYEDPLDRRFHAQPNACPMCGPHLALTDASGRTVPAGDVLRETARLLREGRIVAIKGLGGFQLACDATHEMAVDQLRTRKRRPHKPLAVMMATLDDVRVHCDVSPAEQSLLTGPEAPIVLLRRHPGSIIVGSVAPEQLYLGAMLPYTPLHHVLLRDVGRPLVMTSGNLTEEPIVKDNGEALRRLSGIADFFVLHNRGIYARYDDSVWFVPGVAGHHVMPQPVRRARGYAPFPIQLPFDLPPVLAAGAELKNTFCLTRQDNAFLSQHIGDLENLDTVEHFEATIALYERLFRTWPQRIACDLHPDYLATRYATERARREGLPLVAVQHHHAHLVACLADNGWPLDGDPVIGVTFDGTGLGSDGGSWGGEWLVGGYRGYTRAAHLELLPQPGGDAAVRNPYRLALGYLQALLLDVPTAAIPEGVDPTEVSLIRRQVERGVNAPLTSSAGRLFDAVAALLGVRARTSYEAQAAIELEMRASAVEEQSPGRQYPLEVRPDGAGRIVGLRPLFQGILDDLNSGRPVEQIGWAFHRTLAEMIVRVCELIAAECGSRTVALTGGCFQNRILLRLAAQNLDGAGFRVLTHHRVPCNDGGLALGQAVVAGLDTRV